MQYATGVDLPSELVHRNVEQVVVSTLIEVSGKTIDKRGLAACGTTCRHWARLIRPVLFRRLSLRSSEDIQQPAEFLEDPVKEDMEIGGFIKVMILEQRTLAMPPWLHHVHILLRRLAHPRLELVLGTSSSQINHGTLLCPVDAHDVPPLQILPRTFPYSSIQLRHILLYNLRLRSQTVLENLVDSLPILRTCECTVVTFLSASESAERVRRRTRCHNFYRVSMSDCADSALSSQLILASAILAARERLD